MISKKDLKDNECESLKDYFEIIHTSHINGQKTQARNQIKKLSLPQYSRFINWLMGNASELKEYIK